MDSIPSPRFYVYALARPIKVKRHVEWRIFYVGKGIRRRVFDHDNEARRGCGCHKCNVIRKVWREGSDIQRYTLLTTDDEQEALAYEKEMIALHGRENLCNLTDGGEGTPGKSPEAIARIRAAHIGKKRPKEISEAIAAANRLRVITPATRQKMSETRKGRKHTAESIEKMRIAKRKQYDDPAFRERMRAVWRARTTHKKEEQS